MELRTALYLGAHMPITGGLHKAVERMASLGGTALQIFSRNQRQWRIPELDPEAVALFRQAWREWGEYPVAVHDSYLVNLATPNPEQERKSIHAFAQELRRVETLGIPYLVTHPGSHMGVGREAGIRRYAANLDRAVAMSETNRCLILLETTSGQGTNLGGSFENLARIMEGSQSFSRLGVCLDTCHAFASGYDLRTKASYETAIRDFDKHIGLEKLRFFHLNDSKHPLGSHKDRHEHIGQGHLGKTSFALLLNDPRFQGIPMVIETPKDKSMAWDKNNLKKLRSLIRH